MYSRTTGTRLPGAALLQTSVLNLQGLETFRLLPPVCTGWRAEPLATPGAPASDGATMLPPEGTATLHSQLLRPDELASAPLPRHSDVVLRWEAVPRPGAPDSGRPGVTGISQQQYVAGL